MKIITARFIGEDGSLGFRNKAYYKLKVSFIGAYVYIESVGILNKRQRCQYVNVIKFLDNWTDIKNGY